MPFNPERLRKLRGMAARFRSVFAVSIVACSSVAVWGAVAPESLADAAQAMTGFGLRGFDWLFLSTCTLFLVVCFVLAFSRLGDLKLGKPEEKPEFTLTSWIAMLFAAGMGAGLLFWGAAEPMTHFISPPPTTTSTRSKIWPSSSTTCRWSIPRRG